MNYRGQILAITLLALLIVAIVVIGVYNLTTRDVQQTVANREYQELYNAAETQIFQLIDKYGQNTTQLSTLTNDFPGNCVLAQPNTYNCQFQAGQTSTDMLIQDSSRVDRYELGKDEYIELALNGYRGDVFFSWEGQTALEFGLLYRITGIESGFTFDLFDIASVFDSNGGDPLLNPFSNHQFPFISVGGGEYRFRVRDIRNLPPNAQTSTLRITARKPNPGPIYLNVRGEGNFPLQIRKFTATSYNNQAQSNVVASVITQVPLKPQALSFFNYSLLVNSSVTKAPPIF